MADQGSVRGATNAAHTSGLSSSTWASPTRVFRPSTIKNLRDATTWPPDALGRGSPQKGKHGLHDLGSAKSFAAKRSPPGAARPEWLIRRYSAPIGALNATLDRTFFALSDPTRRGILERLGRGPATIGELAKPFGLTINGVKKHVGILEEVNLVATEKVGRARECQLGPAQLEDATSWIDDYRSTWESRLDRFGSYAEEKHRGR